MTKKGTKRAAQGATKGSETRQMVAALALRVADREGLAGLSIGRLAKELRMSKSGLFLHFGSKEKLESAVIELARLQLFNHAVEPIQEAGLQGIERVWAMCDSWLDFREHGSLQGGYFFTGAFFQSANINGSVPRQIRRVVREWMDLLVEALKEGRRNDEIRRNIDAEEAAFELNIILIGAQWAHLMTGQNYGKARSAILSNLRNLASEEISDRAFKSVKTWKAYLKNRRAPADRQSGPGLSK